MEWSDRLKHDRLERELRALGYELEEVWSMLSRILGRGVAVQPVDPGTQQPGPPSPIVAGRP